MKYNTPQDGLTLLITLLLSSVLLAIGVTMLNVTLKQFELSGIAHSSEVAFQAANAGAECLIYHDRSAARAPGNVSVLDVPGDETSRARVTGLSCLGGTSDDLQNTDNQVFSGEEQRFQYDWGTPAICTDVSIYKFFDDSDPEDMDPLITSRDCPAGVECTMIRSRGYNQACNNLTNQSTVERELVYVY